MCREVVLFNLLLSSMVAMAGETEFRLYRPLTESAFQPPVTITAKMKGECWQQSQRIKREDAWHCVANNKEYDPCFVRPFGTKIDASCIQYPWSTEGIQINVSEALDNGQHVPLDMSKAFPWALVLTTGKKCYSIDSNVLDDGMPVRYRCDEQTTLIGDIQRCNNPWKTLQHDPAGYTSVTIAQVWF
jgi:hypothetical protein